MGLLKILRKYRVKKLEKFPRLLSIEVTSACNSKCVMCPRQKMTRKISHMPFDVFEKIILDCKNQSLEKINMFWFGDPLVNPNIVEYLSFARRVLPKVKLYISTNAELLTAEYTNEILKNDLLDVINFDIDGMTNATYEKIRIGVDFETVIKNVLYFLEQKKRLNKKKPQTRVTIINMKETANEIEIFKKYWSRLVDKVEVNDYNTWGGSVEDKNVGEKIKESQDGQFTYPCSHPWEELVVSSEGIVGLCCLDFDLTAKLGDVMSSSIKDIWNGEKIKIYRNLMIEDKYDKIACCKDCNAYIYQNTSTWARLWRS